MNSEWIPVSSRLPESDGKYLITCGKGPAVALARFWRGAGQVLWQHPHDNTIYPLVVAWMPLPNPYSEEQPQ